MRKFYALIAGLVLCLAGSNISAQTGTPDVANFTFVVNAPNNDVVFTNTSTLSTSADYRRAYWSFGDGTVVATPPLAGTQHHYQLGGTYTVCLKIFRYSPNLNDSVLTAQICKTVVIESICRANFESPATSPISLGRYFVAQPWHNQNKKPVRICWTFGDGRDTCIQYPTNYTGAYGVYHLYSHPGTYQVCVSILYDAGCQATNCQAIVVTEPDNCRANFERIELGSTVNPQTAIFNALPWHNNNKKPARICWTFGDGRDTCIQYSNTFPGPYTVNHTYANAGLYEVCVNILYQGGCEARKCDNIRIGRPDSCRANFEKIPVTSSNNPLSVYYKALPWHNNGKKPSRICWTFGDGRDTCINYLNIYNGIYTVPHTYSHPGQYEVCVNILYYGGCEARKCENIRLERPDTCHADFERIPVLAPNNTLLSYFKALPSHNNNKKPSRICWTFGDGRDTCINYTETFTGQYVTSHLYPHPGQYEVCVKILYFGGCEAKKCRVIEITRPDTCHADFERIATTPGTNLLQTYFRALPQHNNNRKPSRICWTFGDGRDTCINYTETYTGQYAVSHQYAHSGQYEVCVRILYFGGCEARKCKVIEVTQHDICTADFERIPVTSTNNPLQAYFKALPGHNNNRKPSRVCWTFGDGRDTCINYTETYTGQYAVSHQYAHSGQYEVCVRILYFGGCESKKCKVIEVTQPDICTADFERIPVISTNNPLQAYFKALPGHNNNRKPSRVCWTFGDGRDTCINYPENYTGLYGVSHTYNHPGQYEVCVKINYYGGCESRKCKLIQITQPDACLADFEKITAAAGTNPFQTYFRALPQHNNNRKPARICWTFGDGRDTCITYTETYTGQYVVAHNYTQPGQYEVCVRILYFGGCEARKCKVIVIPPVQTTCSVNIFEIAPSITSLVRGFLAVPHTEPTTRRPERICWSFGDGQDTCIMIDPQQPLPDLTIRHTYPAPGVYRACVRILFQGGCVAENCREVVIRAASNVCGGYMTDSLTGPRTFKFKGFSINNPNDEVISYRWTFGDGTSGLGREVTHTYSQAGNYQVCLTIVTRLGCETRICKTVRVPGNNEPALHLTPNPVINVLHVGFLSTHTEQVNIKILNGFGIPVRTYVRNVTVGQNSWDVDLASLMPGIYTFILQSPNQLASAIFIKL